MTAVITANGDCPPRQAELAREWWAREFLTTEFNLLFDPHSFALPFLCPFPSPHGDSGKRSRNRPTEREQLGDPRQAPRLFQFGGGYDAAELAQVAGRKTPVIEQSLANRSGRCAERPKSNRPTDRPFHRPSVGGRTTRVTRAARVTKPSSRTRTPPRVHPVVSRLTCPVASLFP
jgi:hypothetical protein